MLQIIYQLVIELNIAYQANNIVGFFQETHWKNGSKLRNN